MTTELKAIDRDVAAFLSKQAERVETLIHLWTMDGPSPETCQAVRAAIEKEQILNDLASRFDTSEPSLKIEAVVNQKWQQQGPICTLTEFLDVNPDLDPLYVAQAVQMLEGDVLHWNLGAAGVLKITRVS